MIMAKRVMLVDDNPAIRAAVRQAFSRGETFIICGEASNGQEAIDRVAALKPHLIILDISMPVMNGTDAAPHLLRLAPTVCIIFFSMFAGKELQHVAKQLGVHAVVSKTEGAEKLIVAARSLLGLGANAASTN
jgi:DNA-binding NarL/FixJ family response regulator